MSAFQRQRIRVSEISEIPGCVGRRSETRVSEQVAEKIRIQSGVYPFFPAWPFPASLRNTGECPTWFPPIPSHAAMLYVIDNEQARTIRHLTPGGARAPFSIRE